MPAVTINAVPYAGQPSDLESVLRAPIEAKRIPVPITFILVGLDGTRNKMSYGTKYRYEYEWKKVPQATRDALWTAFAITATFSIIHIDSVTYTVQFEEEGDWSEGVDHTTPDGSRYYNISLKMHQP
jgi:hypothetical protein